MNSGVHDEINLARLVRRLEKSVAHEEWNALDSNGGTWLKAEGVLQVPQQVTSVHSTLTTYFFRG